MNNQTIILSIFFFLNIFLFCRPAPGGASLHVYPGSTSPVLMNTSSTNMYALHEHGESHDESSESEHKLKKKSAENNGISGDATETEVDPDSILGDDLHPGHPTNAKIGLKRIYEGLLLLATLFESL